MRKSDKQIHEAMVFEHLTATKSKPYFTMQLYCINDVPGIWRRVPRGSSEAKGTPPVLAYFDGKVIELMKDEDATKEACMALAKHVKEEKNGAKELFEEEEQEQLRW